MKVYEARMVYTLVREDIGVSCSLPSRVVEYMKGAFDDYPAQEQFWVIFLDRKNQETGRHRVTIGTVSAALAHPREIFRAAIVATASSVVLVHNHPSGDPAPSANDLGVTRILSNVGKVVDIPVVDHVIIGDPKADPTGKGYFSFKEAGLV